MGAFKTYSNYFFEPRPYIPIYFMTNNLMQFLKPFILLFLLFNFCLTYIEHYYFDSSNTNILH